MSRLNRFVFTRVPKKRLKRTTDTIEACCWKTYCGFRQQGAAVSRSRRTVDQAKTSCLLHLHADHLYYKRFKTVEAVVAQVTNLNQT